jgi:hypothetical protein
MDKQQLIDSASVLGPFSKETANAYSSKADKMIAAINTIMAQRSDIESLTGANNLEMMKDNHANHARFIASILTHFNPEVLVDTITWVFRAYISHGFASTYWAAQLNAWIHLIEKEMSEQSLREIVPLYLWMQINIPAFDQLARTQLHDPAYKPKH